MCEAASYNCTRDDSAASGIYMKSAGDITKALARVPPQPIIKKRNDEMPTLLLRNPQNPNDQKFLDFTLDDILELALAGHDADYENELFTKYFKPEDATFVKQCFSNILGKPDDDGYYTGNPMLYDRTKLMLLRSPITPQFGIYDRCDHEQKTAYTQSDGDRFGPSPYAVTDHEQAIIVFCPASIRLLIPLLDRNCDTLGEHVSINNMVPTGYYMFHELFHWTALVNPTGARMVSRIRDVWGTPQDPPISPYGPYDTVIINQRKTPTMNADNFAWFALEAFYTKHCDKRFLPADSSESMYPEYTNGAASGQTSGHTDGQVNGQGQTKQ